LDTRINKKRGKKKRKEGKRLWRYTKTLIIIPPTSYMPRAMLRVNYILHFKKNQDLKVLGFFAKLYIRVLGLVAMPDPKVIFIVLIITLNLG
jgi:hypothetical protein